MRKTLSAIRLTFFLMGATLAACASPNPNTAAGRADIAGQKCEICILENTGDGAPCYAICSQRVEDQAAYMKAYAR